MKKRLCSILILIAFFILPLGLIDNDTQMSSITRPRIESEYIYIDPNAIPLAGNLQPSNPLCAATLDEINNERAAVGLSKLIKSGDLAAAAAVRAEECDQLFSHTRPSGEDWWTVNSTICYGENLAFGYNNAKDVVIAWMNSPIHKELLLDKEFITCGLGVFTSNTGKTYIAAEFGY